MIRSQIGSEYMDNLNFWRISPIVKMCISELQWIQKFEVLKLPLFIDNRFKNEFETLDSSCFFCSQNLFEPKWYQNESQRRYLHVAWIPIGPGSVSHLVRVSLRLELRLFSAISSNKSALVTNRLVSRDQKQANKD